MVPASAGPFCSRLEMPLGRELHRSRWVPRQPNNGCVPGVCLSNNRGTPRHRSRRERDTTVTMNCLFRPPPPNASTRRRDSSGGMSATLRFRCSRPRLPTTVLLHHDCRGRGNHTPMAVCGALHSSICLSIWTTATESKRAHALLWLALHRPLR